MRDSSRVRIKLPLQDTNGDGSNNASSDVYLCVTSAITFSGITRNSVQTTCSETTDDDWGNIFKTFTGSKMIDAGTVTIPVDWGVDDEYGGREFVTLLQGSNGDYIIEFPAGAGETAGPKITLTGHVTSFTPNIGVLDDADGARTTAELVLKISGIPVFTAPVEA